MKVKKIKELMIKLEKLGYEDFDIFDNDRTIVLSTSTPVYTYKSFKYNTIEFNNIRNIRHEKDSEKSEEISDKLKN